MPHLQEEGGYPAVSAYLVAAPAGVHDKQRPHFEARWTQLTGRDGTVGEPVRELPEPAPRRPAGSVRRAVASDDVTLIV
ncbi:hypothetical protein [Streptomyces sp. NPDC046685]|uniref:hypothetical protein n=1 Tax=Streptomyces sp. NPDC046685 TaxID=3157202 RepID=UPI0033EA695B